MSEIRMESVEFGDDYRLNILLSNGHGIIYNLKPKLITARFRDICDPEVYKKGRVAKGKIIRWNGNTELTLGEIMLNVNDPDR